MRRKKSDWEKFIERIEAGRVQLRVQLGLPPYRKPASKIEGHVAEPKFGARTKNRTGLKPRTTGRR